MPDFTLDATPAKDLAHGSVYGAGVRLTLVQVLQTPCTSSSARPDSRCSLKDKSSARCSLSKRAAAPQTIQNAAPLSGAPCPLRSLGFQSLRAASGRAIFSTFQQLAFPRRTSRVSSTAAHAMTQNGGPLRTGPSELRKGLCSLRSRTRRHRQGHLGEQRVPVRGGVRTVVKTTARE